jgi:hypothetical protein
MQVLQTAHTIPHEEPANDIVFEMEDLLLCHGCCFLNGKISACQDSTKLTNKSIGTHASIFSWARKVHIIDANAK